MYVCEWNGRLFYRSWLPRCCLHNWPFHCRYTIVERVQKWHSLWLFTTCWMNAQLSPDEKPCWNLNIFRSDGLLAGYVAHSDVWTMSTPNTNQHHLDWIIEIKVTPEIVSTLDNFKRLVPCFDRLTLIIPWPCSRFLASISSLSSVFILSLPPPLRQGSEYFKRTRKRDRGFQNKTE